MSELIDKSVLMEQMHKYGFTAPDMTVHELIEDELPTIDAVPIQFIDEVIEYLTKCRDNAIHEETQTAWDEQRQTLIMLLHEWAAWNECGRTGKYGEREVQE